MILQICESVKNHMLHRSELPWLQHEPSTYSYLGRNDAAVNWLLQQREEIGLAMCKKIIILGSGMIEPFAIAALPQAAQAEIIAVEIEKDLVELGHRVRSGESITWEEVASISRHPGSSNRQLLEKNRIKKGLNQLKELGSLDLLGSGVTEESFQVSEQLSSRVTFINRDSLSALEELDEADLICDFFVQTNINKSGDRGVAYTRKLIEEAVASLSSQGMYLIGDTGYNHHHTLGHIAGLALATINAGSLVHIVNKDNNFSSSWYLAISRGDLLGSDKVDGIRERIASLANETGLEIREVRHTYAELASNINQALYLAYLADKEGLITWSTVSPLPQALLHLARDPESEFGETIIFPDKNYS